jgi:hypothetical protein
MDEQKFLPFFERLLIRFPGYNMVGEVLVSMFLGLAFLAAHYMSIGNKVFVDWSWFLSVVITNGMLCLYYGMYTFRNLLTEMEMRLRPDGNEVYMISLKRILSDRHFVLAGLFFGILTCWVEYSFGLPYSDGHAELTILMGFFLGGFVHGLPALAIYGIFVSIGEFSRKAKRSFDFTSLDRCVGTQFLGEALVKFSLLFLLAGVMISISIMKSKWLGENTEWIRMLKYLWIVLPYVFSLFALIAPAVPINKELRQYKMEQDIVLQNSLAEIRKQLKENQLDAAKRMDLREDYKFQQSVREDLHRMRTWPYGMDANLQYLAGFVPSLFASVHSASTWLNDIAVK